MPNMSKHHFVTYLDNSFSRFINFNPRPIDTISIYVILLHALIQTHFVSFRFISCAKRYSPSNFSNFALDTLTS